MENAKKRIILSLNNSPPPQTHSEIETAPGAAFGAFAVIAAFLAAAAVMQINGTKINRC